MEPLVGTAEIRIRLGGVSAQRVYAITRKPGFPAPIATLIMGRVWRRADVEEWIAANRAELDDQGDG
jgi:predicted DNA-binding transcriptional regulator AlpA